MIRSLSPTAIEVEAHDTSIGDVTVEFYAPTPLDDADMTAIEGAFCGIANAAGSSAKTAVEANPRLCIRCARTLMRAAMGDQVAQAMVLAAEAGRPLNAGDDKRYAALNGPLGQHVEAIVYGMRVLAEAVSSGQTADLGSVMPEAPPKPTSAVAALYHSGGWPLKAGQWEGYKACACGDSESGQQPTSMGTKDPMVKS